MEHLGWETTSLSSIVDFLRFGLSRASAHALYFGHGTDNAWDDVWALVLGSLSLPLDVDPLLLQGRLTPEEANHVLLQLQRRIIERIPVPYLTHTAYFCGMSFYVDERVLIPRSPFAELILQQFYPWIEAERVERVLDLCTGSGCIAIACAHAFPDALVDGSDISTGALEVAALNAARHGVEEQVQWLLSDGFNDLSPVLYDLIVCNPPYVSHEEMQTLPAEYLHEPRLALEASHQGLAFVHHVLRTAHHYLSEHGVLVVEVGNSEEALIEAYPHAPFTWLDFEHGGQGVFLLTREQLLEVIS